MIDAATTNDSVTTMGELKQLVQEFVDERDWGKYHNAKDVAIAINVEAAELLELFEWVREKDLPALLEDAVRKRRVAEELADIMILCLNLASAVGLDVAQIVAQKTEANRAKYPAHLVKGNYRKYTELREEAKKKGRNRGV